MTALSPQSPMLRGLSLRNISKIYRSQGTETVALDEVSLSASGHEFVSIVGPSGCGKTTLLKIIAGLTSQSGGTVEFDPPQPSGRLRTALVFQDHALLPWRTVLQNVELGRAFQNPRSRDFRGEAERILDQMGLSRFLHRLPHELSTGMQQRVGLARAILSGPEALLLDEPFGSLDAQTRLVLQDELLRIWTGHQGIFILVTHDLDEAIYLSDRIYVLSGRPATVRHTLNVTLPRPRQRADLGLPEVAELRAVIWSALREEVREHLAMREAD